MEPSGATAIAAGQSPFSALGTQLEDPPFSSVCRVDVAVRGDGHTKGVVEQWELPPGIAPLGKQCPPKCHDGNGPTVRDVERSRRDDCERRDNNPGKHWHPPTAALRRR